MQDGILSQKQHESNIFTAVSNYTVKDLPKYLLFDELLELSNGTLKQSEIGATTPELITSGVLSYDNIFKFGYDQNYCLIILKNRNYICVLVKKSENGEEIYAVRDCHENSQMNFNNFEDLRNFLNKTYQFEQITCVDGVLLPEFSNIEYLVIDTPFELINIDTDLTDDTLEEDTSYSENKIEHVTEVTNFDIDQEMAIALQMTETDSEYTQFI
jgi:hypothetical protein